jgi:hypothetical protein
MNGPDCVTGAACVGDSAAMSGTCKKLSELATRGMGESCNPSEESFCQEGLSCVVDTGPPMMTFKCAAPSSTGGTCRVGVPDPCPGEEYCDADTANGSYDGICHKLPTDGQPCASEGFGFSPSCAIGYICDGTDTCRMKQRIGASCVEDGVCYSGACEGNKCVAAPICEAPMADPAP